MIYLPDDCVFYIVSFFRDKNMKYDPIEILFLSLTCKCLNFVVKKYSFIKKLTNEEHTRAVEQYYYASMYNMKMIHELESLNMRSIPLYSFPSFLVRISENVVMLKYFYDNPFFGVNTVMRIKIRLNLEIVNFLLRNVTNSKSLTFLQELVRLDDLRMTYDYNDDQFAINIILNSVESAKKNMAIEILNWARANETDE